MTPYELLIIVAIIAVARFVLTLRPVRVGSNGKSTSYCARVSRPVHHAGIAAWILITFVARTYYIPSASMLPTLQSTTCCWSISSSIAFTPDTQATSSCSRRRSRRRTTSSSASSASPAMRLRIFAGIVYVNERALNEPYTAAKPAYELEVRNYGIYVSDGSAGKRSIHPRPTFRRSRSGRRRTRFRRIAIS